MSSFTCTTCGAQCIDTRYGYVTGCEHHPHDCRCSDSLGLCPLCAIRAAAEVEGGIELALEMFELPVTEEHQRC